MKTLKKNGDIFSAGICDFLNETIRSGKFLAILENSILTIRFQGI